MIDCSFISVEEVGRTIADENPTGIDPRKDVSPSSNYYQLKDKRRSLRDAERSALINEEESGPLPSEWGRLAEEIYSAIVSEAKDLEYSAWLIEALCRSSGFAGLKKSFECARVVIENFWETLYPEPDEDGLETRIAPLIGLNGYDGDGTLMSPILSIPILELSPEQCFATWHYIRASEQSRKSDEGRAQSGIEVTLESMFAMVSEAPAEYFGQYLIEVDQAIAAFSELTSAIDNAMGGTPQPTSAILRAMEQCRDAVLYIAKDKLSLYETEQQASDDIDPVEEGSGVGESKTPADMQVQNRHQVIQSLREAANFFRKTEPHSPISYALEKVVHWSNLELPDLLEELIDDKSSRSQFYRLTGINESKDEK